MQKIIIPLKISGSLAIIFATLILTVKIYNIDNELSDINEKIISHKNNALLSMQFLSTINDKFTQRRLDLFERNNFILNHKTSSPLMHQIEERIFETTKIIIKKWDNSLKEISEGEEDWGKLEIELNKIVNDGVINFEDKLQKLENIRHEKAKLFKSRSENYQKLLKNYRSDEIMIKHKKIFWNTWFIWLQVLGLISLSISEILDSKENKRT